MVLEHHIAKNVLREREGEKLGLLEEKKDCYVNPSTCARSCKKEEGRRKKEDARESDLK